MLVVTRISIPEEVSIEKQEYVQLQTVMGMYNVDDVKRTEGPLKENQPDHREKGIQGRAPWTWQRR